MSQPNKRNKKKICETDHSIGDGKIDRVRPKRAIAYLFVVCQKHLSNGVLRYWFVDWLAFYPFEWMCRFYCWLLNRLHVWSKITIQSADAIGLCHWDQNVIIQLVRILPLPFCNVHHTRTHIQTLHPLSLPQQSSPHPMRNISDFIIFINRSQPFPRDNSSALVIYHSFWPFFLCSRRRSTVWNISSFDSFWFRFICKTNQIKTFPFIIFQPDSSDKCKLIADTFHSTKISIMWFVIILNIVWKCTSKKNNQTFGSYFLSF